MPYITRDDGEHFVIPSYRDVLSAKQKSLLKKDILLLSQSYGEYITLQRKSAAEYEVAFSPDTGYLLGESIWHQFKRPPDMIYCEAIPNTTEAILVIVKNGSVYLDGSFPIESIPEELIIFLTQQNNFEIYIYGEVPISATPIDGKFSFEEKSVKSFTVLDAPVFPTLALLKTYQLQLVDPVLKEHGIGIFPTRQVITGIVILGLIWMAWSYLTAPKPVEMEANQINPYVQYNTKLASPAPDQEIRQFVDRLKVLLALPGWVTKSVNYANGSITAAVQSTGGKTDTLFEWAKENGFTVSIKQDGIYVSMDNIKLSKRPIPTKIYPLKQIIGNFVDKLSTVYPGNHFKLSDFTNKGVFTDVIFTVSFDSVTPAVLVLIGDQSKDLPFVLQEIKLDVKEGNLTGSINLEALGS